MDFEIPKSDSLALYLLSRRILEDFMSLWKIGIHDDECMYARAFAVSVAICRRISQSTFKQIGGGEGHHSCEEATTQAIRVGAGPKLDRLVSIALLITEELSTKAVVTQVEPLDGAYVSVEDVEASNDANSYFIYLRRIHDPSMHDDECMYAKAFAVSVAICKRISQKFQGRLQTGSQSQDVQIIVEMSLFHIPLGFVAIASTILGLMLSAQRR
ncbi:hypothetical protein Cgig2_004239 [Carnegiea gigantea]|uniref:Uncharacterized protein n=1 Tax=Carnegiea gigantea TaxID=171969 RepID=A0A9Q1K3J1_9CARY|nr:hypothetical protein Cgig2_004239 [Carnegiea gigantea]